MSDFYTETERNLFSAENRPVGFYTEPLLSAFSEKYKIMSEKNNNGSKTTFSSQHLKPRPLTETQSYIKH